MAELDLEVDLEPAKPTGEVQSVVDSKVSDPFGKSLAVTGTAPNVGFQSDWTDPTSGLVWMGARWYSPNTGTFTARDTVPGSVGAYATMNRYTYGLNNPITYNDPTGRYAMDADGGGGTAAPADCDNACQYAYLQQTGNLYDPGDSYNDRFQNGDLDATTEIFEDADGNPVIVVGNDLGMRISTAGGTASVPFELTESTVVGSAGVVPPPPDACQNDFDCEEAEWRNSVIAFANSQSTPTTTVPKRKIYKVLPPQSELDPGELKHQKEIEKWSKANGINPLLLAALMYHEGGGFIGSAGRRQVWKQLDRRSGSNGMMNIQVDTAKLVLKQVYGEPVPSNLAAKLTNDDDFSLKIAAGYVKYLSDTYQVLGDRQLFLAYASSPKTINQLKQVNFDPHQIAPLGASEDTVEKLIRRNDIFWPEAVQSVTDKVR